MQGMGRLLRLTRPKTGLGGVHLGFLMRLYLPSKEEQNRDVEKCASKS
jgi:hypothetical protein